MLSSVLFKIALIIKNWLLQPLLKYENLVHVVVQNGDKKWTRVLNIIATSLFLK